MTELHITPSAAVRDQFTQIYLPCHLEGSGIQSRAQEIPVPSYVYSPITENEIRLLRLYRGQDGSISGTLESFLRNSPQTPQYKALSYAWEAPIYTWSIAIDGKELPVLQSLRPFTDMLCCSEPFCEDIWWWIDSICIDMQNFKERDAQVCHMGEIYRQAEETWVWLGPRFSDSDEAIDFLKDLRTLKCEYELTFGENESIVKKLLLEYGLRDEGYRSKWVAIENLLQRRWFTRVWTVQEFILSSKVTFYCGSKSIDRRVMFAALYAIWCCGGADGVLIRKDVFNSAWIRRRLYQWYEANISSNGSKTSRISLIAMVAYFNNQDATDPKDLIYSFLGLSPNLPFIQPMYHISTEDAYYNFAKSYINEFQSLDIICFADRFKCHSYSTCSSKLPSWVPDWRVKAEPMVVPVLVSQSAQALIGNFRPLHSIDTSVIYESSGSVQSSVEFSIPGELKCQGIFLDFLDGIGGSIPYSISCQDRNGTDCNGSEESLVQSTFETNVSVDDGQMNDNQEFCKTKMRTLMISICRSLVLNRHDCYLRHVAPIEQYLRDFQTFCSSTMESSSKVHWLFRSWFSANKSLKIHGVDLEILCKGMSDSIATSEIDLFDLSSYELFLSRLRDTILKRKRRLLVTERGYVGMAPPRAKKGDLICILLGCSVPVLLRRYSSEGLYQFVGECYVDGYMNGEALADTNLTSENKPVFRII
jgi:heterokaryon incompatibility protein (HET)